MSDTSPRYTEFEGRRIRLCEQPGCDRLHWGRGLCRYHYVRRPDRKAEHAAYVNETRKQRRLSDPAFAEAERERRRERRRRAAEFARRWEKAARWSL